MGRPPSNGGPSFRFNPVEVGEMEAILQSNNCAVPAKEILDNLAHRFSASAERAGKVEVSVKQVWNWFQNRRYAIRAKAARVTAPGPQVNVSTMPREDPSAMKLAPQAPYHQPPQPPISHPQAPQMQPALSTVVRSLPQVPQPLPVLSVQTIGRNNASENPPMEFEAKSFRDGAWYDVACFLSHRSVGGVEPDQALVRFSGFGQEEDEWVVIRKHVRQRSLPCESSECVAVLPGDLILCFQEGKEQALYFDAHVLDAQRRRHDVRGCRCRFLVRYDHDQSEEIVPLRKICRRPETDYRLQQLHGNLHKTTRAANTMKVETSIATAQKHIKPEGSVASVETGYGTAAATTQTTNTESKIQAAKIPDTGNAVESIPNPGIQQAKIPDTGNPVEYPGIQQAKIPDTGNPVESIPNPGIQQA